jgi:type II secretory ATPase GspE/PulE/Tfp pilus assembly ATPase PilB-like protein
VILIGEVRDRETADMAIKAAMTGHLVLSTLHTNSAVGALPRLEDIGIEPYLIQDSLIGVMAQRLVRRICSGCRTEVEPTPDERSWLGTEAEHIWRGKGCARCGGSGYRGRTVIVELFLPNAEIADAMRSGAGLAELTRIAVTHGFRPMMEDGKRLVLEGRTTCDEVLRVSSAHWLTEEEREVV